MNLKDHIRGIPDFPTPGILFYDISPLLADPAAWQATVERLAEIVHQHEPDVLAGIESRGFLVAAPLALRLNKGFVMVRKQGKLRSEEHTSELQSLMRISYAVFCLKQKNTKKHRHSSRERQYRRHNRKHL